MNTPALTKNQLIAVFGGSGATGRALIGHALTKGLLVRTLVRKASLLSIKSEQVEIIEGSILNSEVVGQIVKKCSAVLCVFGPRPPYTDIFCSRATNMIIASMHQCGGRRLICQTGGMIGDYPRNRTFPFKIMTSLFNKRFPLIANDREGQEHAVRNSGLTWTIVKPPRLTNAPATGQWVIGPEVRLGLRSSITREDLVEFLIQEALEVKYKELSVFVRN